MQSSISSFRRMIKSINHQSLIELCEKFLTDHEDAMRTLLDLSENYGLCIDEVDAKRYMMDMQLKGEFDSVECFGIELGDNSLYKKFHPSVN